MPDINAYRIVLWADTPLYTCQGCGFQRFREDFVQAHCATCPALAALTDDAAGLLPTEDEMPSPAPAYEEDT